MFISAALVIQKEKGMRHVTLLSVASMATQRLSTLSRKWLDFLVKNVIEHKMCVLIFSAVFD